ncbi:MAG: serine/threonine-protein kinase [Planctomycetota bacterium]
MVQAVCLSDLEIIQYLNGDTSDAETSRIEFHLNSCPSCESLAADLEKQGDWLTRHLRLAPDSESTDDLSKCQIERLQGIPFQAPAMLGHDDSSVASTSVVSTTEPRSIYHYRLGPQIGRGGMGVVYRSEHPQLHRPVAIKLLSASHADEATAITRFQREMRAAGGLDHPGIVRAFDAGSWQGTYYFVMEYIEGTDLSRLIQRVGPLEVSDACAIIVETAEALQYAHEHQVLHRDIKPSNLILTHDGKLKILDFGLARMDHGRLSGQDMTTTGRLVGTLDYASPEQASGELPVDERSDIYGLGATLFRLLTGRPPHGFSAQRPLLQFLKELTAENASPISELRQDVPPPLCELVGKLIARDPLVRPSSAAEVAEQLKPFAESADLAALSKLSLQQPTNARQTSNSVEHEVRPVTPSNKRGGLRWIPALLTLLLGIGLGISGLTFWLKTGTGTIRIESNVDDVHLQLIEADGETESIEVNPGENETRIRVGNYELRMEGDIESVKIDASQISLMRGETRVVRITREDSSKTATESSPSLPTMIKDHLSSLEEAWKSLKAEYGDSHPVTVAARNKFLDSKNSVLHAVTGESVGARTSRGRTYRQWTDIVLRETNAETIVEGTRALVDLSTPLSCHQTMETLERVAASNDSQDQNSISDNFIGLFYAPPETPSQNDPGRISKRPRETTETANRRAWESVYGQPNPEWSTVVNAILDARRELRPLLNSEFRSADGSATSQNLSLAMIAMQKSDPAIDDVEFVRQVFLFAKSPHTRAIAHHVWLKKLDQDPTTLLTSKILQESIPVRKAVVNTLLIEDKIVKGIVLGNLVADLILEDVSLHKRSIHEVLLSSFEDHAGFESSESGKMIRCVAERVVSYLEKSPEKIAKSLGIQELLRHLSSADLLDEGLRQRASNGLHVIIRNQIEARGLVNYPVAIDQIESLPILFSAMTATALDGEIPSELIGATIPERVRERFDSFLPVMLESSNREELYQWLMLFPVKTTSAMLKACERRLIEARDLKEIQARNDIMSDAIDVVRSFDPAFALSVALHDLDDASSSQTLDLIMGLHENAELTETRLVFPVNVLSDRFLQLARNHTLGTRSGFALRLAQLGGASDDEILSVLNRRLDDESNSGRVNLQEFGWYLECLSNVQQANLSQDRYEDLVDRIFTQDRRSIAPHVRPTFSASMDRSALACLRLRERVNFVRGEDRLLRHLLGLTRSQLSLAPFRGNRVGSTLFSRHFPDKVIIEMFHSIIRNPPSDAEVLKALRERAKVLFRMSPHHESVSLVNEAITKIDARIAESN